MTPQSGRRLTLTSAIANEWMSMHYGMDMDNQNHSKQQLKTMKLKLLHDNRNT